MEIKMITFDDGIKYAGPDCGLGAWPNQGLTFGLLKNTSIGIKNFLKNNEEYCK
jgi:5-methyltetrahydropteroyltriglutamate--homocysteine methyltransferase